MVKRNFFEVVNSWKQFSYQICNDFILSARMQPNIHGSKGDG